MPRLRGGDLRAGGGGAGDRGAGRAGRASLQEEEPRPGEGAAHKVNNQSSLCTIPKPNILFIFVFIFNILCNAFEICSHWRFHQEWYETICMTAKYSCESRVFFNLFRINLISGIQASQASIKKTHKRLFGDLWPAKNLTWFMSYLIIWVYSSVKSSAKMYCFLVMCFRDYNSWVANMNNVKGVESGQNNYEIK